MPAIRITRRVAMAVIAAASMTAVTVAMTVPAQASIVGKDDGYGATLQLAEQNALSTLHGDYYGCKPPPYYYDSSQLADGTWYTWVSENCQGYY
jgi:hypothetical protein